ncbi:subtilase family protein [Kribbella steppae]|uniref:Subtilase family protein n=1 Tax=Kribbella steppae TaxID=2512223 RepID=A0A4R2HQP1_9ACTN|nr:S8 family serine peptidase [Kribbella steppae]TCO32788.1 subtilase family protein [Kribbella steppae]
MFFRSLARKTLAGASVTALLAVAAVPASASPPQPAAEARPTLPVQVDAEKVVTLLTGDKVQVSPAGTGRSNVRFVPADPAQAGYETRTVGKDLYVVPDSAAKLVNNGKVDQALFNVSGLIRQGYDDVSTSQIPVIATYKPTARAAQQAVPAGSTRTRMLSSVGAAALRTDKARARETWQTLSTGRDVQKLWLDAKVRKTLDQSVPYVGAPQAWQAGYDGSGTTVAVLDSGVDAEHPDLVGAVKAQQNFTDSPDVTDHDGHGTHTSSTVAGRGVASNGKNKGVAPGTQLLSGKVLNDYGSGELSWIIAGMEWAVAEGADVISMSIGTSEPVDCTDPMAAAVDRISAASGVLVVVAAGNLYGPAETITSPGCAASALTVAATDLTQTTADFSSRGPVMGNHAVKPDIAAPGVDITAARAGGRGDSAYTDMNGTSMATPHVAGAAAILKQQHPDWNGQQLKAALQNSVRSASTVAIYEQGAGELDVAQAVAQQVTGPGTTDLGTFAWPHTLSDKITKQLAYHNSGTQPVTLTFAVDARGNNGKPLPASLISFGSGSLTVPAGGTAELPVTVDPSASLDRGLYGAISARVVATGNDGRTVVTPLGFYLEPQFVDVTFKLIDRNGQPASSITALDVFDTDSIAAQRIGFDGADRTLHLRAGTYSLAAIIATGDAAGMVESYAFLGDPEITLTNNTTITYDARTAAEATVTTQRPTERKGGSLTYGRMIDNWILASSRSFGKQIKSIYLSETPEARRGTFEVVEGWQYASPAGAKSPYLYSLAFTHQQQIKGKPEHRVRDRDLATIDATYYTPGKDYTYSEYVDVWRPWSINLIPTGDRGAVAAPTRVQHLVTADRDTKVSQMVGHSDTMSWPFATLMTSTATSYQAGSRHTESWWKAGLRPGMVTDQTTGQKYVPAARDGNSIWSNFPTWSDTEPGHFSRGGFLDLGGTELLADGVSLGEYGFYGQGYWDVPAAATNFELVYDLIRWQRGDYKWESPTTAETRWKWNSSAVDAGKPLPLLFPDYDLPVDLNDRAPRVRAFPITITAESGHWYQAGRFTKARVWTSYDDGATWTQVPVLNLGTKVVALADNTKATDFVTLKVELTDSNHKSVTQTLNRFYKIR